MLSYVYGARRLPVLCLTTLAVLAGCGGGADGDAGHAAALRAPAAAQAAAASSPTSDDSGPTMSIQSAGSTSSTTAQLVSTLVRGNGWVAAAGISPVQSPNGYLPNFGGRGWYVDPSQGNDANPGTQAAPWRTMAPATRTTFALGDALLLKCGEVHRDGLRLTNVQVPQANLLIGGYGDCSGDRRPVLRGSDWVAPTGWSRVGGEGQEIHARRMTTDVRRLFLDGVPLVRARYPNFQRVGAEFARSALTTTPSTTSFRVNADDLAVLDDKDVVGATIYVRATQWQSLKAKVVSFDPGTGTVTLDRAMPEPIQSGTGYILEGKAWMLDAPGEWHFTSGNRELLLWAPGGVNPATLNGLEAGWRPMGIVAMWVRGLRIERLAIEQFDENGIDLLEAPDAVVSDVRVRQAQNAGITVLSSPRVVIRDSQVRAAGYAGIISRETDGARLQRNQVTDTGSDARAGETEAAISVFGRDALVEGNLVERAASFGIRFANRTGTVIRGNTVMSFCQRFTDCGGIYTFTGGAVSAQPTRFVATGLVEGNVVVDARSNADGCGNRCNNLAAGIYLDQMSAGVTVSGNSVASTEIGILLHNASFNRIVGNRVSGSSATALRASQTRVEAGLFRGNLIADNTWFSHRDVSLPVNGLPVTTDTSTAMHWHHPVHPMLLLSGTQPNVVSGNRNLSILKAGEVTWGMTSGTQKLLLKQAEWRSFAPSDIQANPVTHVPYKIDLDPSLVANGGFDAKLTGTWSAYLSPTASGSSFTMGRFSNCSGSCARLVAGTSADYLVSKPFVVSGLAGSNLYLLSYKATGGPTGGLRKAYVRRAVSPWENFGLNLPAQTLAPGESLLTEAFFRATASSNQAVLDIRSAAGHETLVSNVSLSRVRTFRPLLSAKAMRQIVNHSDTPQAYTCSAIGLSSCSLADEDGNLVGFPMTVPARSVRTVFVRNGATLY